MGWCWWITSITFQLFTRKIQYSIVTATLGSLTSSFAGFSVMLIITPAEPLGQQPPHTAASSLGGLNVSTWIINKSTGISERLVSSCIWDEHLQINLVSFGACCCFSEIQRPQRSFCPLTDLALASPRPSGKATMSLRSPCRHWECKPAATPVARGGRWTNFQMNLESARPPGRTVGFGWAILRGRLGLGAALSPPRFPVGGAGSRN